MLNQKYQNQSTNLASYDYYDIAEGTGLKGFYPAAATASGAITYLMTDQVLYSSPLAVYKVDGTAVYNFDLSPFSTPKVIKGTCSLNVCWNQHGAQAGQWGTILLEIKKNSGGTLTTLGSVNDYITSNAALVSREDALMQTTLPETPFKVGDILRLTATLYSAGVAGSTGFGCDPQNRASGDFTHTQTKIHIPFRLDT